MNTYTFRLHDHLITVRARNLYEARQQVGYEAKLLKGQYLFVGQHKYKRA